MQKERVTYLLARLPIGISFLGHGLVRIPNLNKFSEGMLKGFSETMLPGFIVEPFAIILPFLELILGIAIVIGFRMKIATIAGAILICVLIFGSSLQENWSAVTTQMFYGVYLSMLYLFAEHNYNVFKKKAVG